ncbi:hypothetical protein [Nostoc sp. PCC 7524]|uniref:hypothetical protein n=1 Tax=Nostoc sp. (strain ATCC 29411 / PCC 7524) TaxID=28072 RepID=UPI000AF025FB|nr:hypothetical protein [Nostoc sp. PCC 7524]
MTLGKLSPLTAKSWAKSKSTVNKILSSVRALIKISLSGSLCKPSSRQCTTSSPRLRNQITVRDEIPMSAKNFIIKF